MEKKKRGIFFFFEGEVIKYICLMEHMYTLDGLTAMNIFGLLHVSACFSQWTVAAKYFLGAILSVLQVIHKKYPWSDWNRFC